MIKVNIQYFAMLKERRGCSNEEISVEEVDIQSLYKELDEKYNFKLTEKDLKFAVNDNFVSSEYVLKNGDDIVFIPPVGGG
jgi:sulfur-carrier protein